MFFPLIAVAAAVCIFLARGTSRSALRLALYAWAASVLLPALPLFHYNVEYSVETDALVAGCLLITTLVYKWTRAAPRPAPAMYTGAAGREATLAWSLAVLGIIGGVLLLLDAQARGTQLSAGFLLENLSSIRATTFQSLGDEASSLAVVGNYLAACSLLAIIAALRLGGRMLVALASIGFVVLAMVSVFVYGGRTILFVALLLAGVSWYLSGRRIRVFRFRTWLGAAAAMLLVVYFSVSWLGTRQGAGFNPENDLAGTQRAEYHPWVAPLARSNDAVATGLLSLGYFAAPLPTLTFYMDQQALPGPYAGAYSFPLPARMVSRASGAEAKSSVDLRAEVFEPLEASGYFGNVWSTWLRDLLVDFGVVGTLVFSAIFGAFMAWARNRFERTGALHYHYLEVIACLTFGFGAFTSYLPFALLSSAFFTAIVVVFVTRVRLSKPAVAPQIRRA